MKKAFLTLALILSFFSAHAGQFEFGLGPSINVKDAVTSFAVMPSVGSKFIRFGLLYQVGSVAGITLQGIAPRIIIEYPFEFNLSNDHSWTVGPVMDFGPGFAFGGGLKSISFCDLGFGAKFNYFFNKSVGVSVVPLHLGMSFASWTSGGVGVTTGLAMVYDLFFSFVYRW
jgi:hypothetical protein